MENDEDAKEEASKETQLTDPGVAHSLTAQCCAFLRMKSYAELSRELGRERMMEGEAGTESSSAGKIRRRSGGRPKSWVDVMAGRDYLGGLISSYSLAICKRVKFEACCHNH